MLMGIRSLVALLQLQFLWVSGIDRKRSASQIIFAQKWRLPAGSQNNNTNALHICTAVIS
jgi:hypothetical protein